MTLYLWAEDASTDFDPRLVATVEVEGAQVRVLDCERPELATQLAELASRPSLPLLGELQVRTSRAMTCEDIPPGDPAYELAIAQAMSQELGYRVSWTPEGLG